MTVEELNVIITAQNTEFNRRMDEVNRRLNNMSDTAQTSADRTYSIFRGLAGKLAALGIGKIIADSVTEGMNAVESESLFETSLGAYADSARAWSEELSASLGLDDYALRKNVGMLYTMTKNMGVAGNSALSMSQDITKLSEDMASFYNISSDEAFAKLQSGITGEVMPLRRLGILVDETTVKQYAYKVGIAEVGTELTQTQKVLARYAAIMDQTSTAQGDLARTIDSPANQLRILKNEAVSLMREVGTAMLPTVSSIFSLANAGLKLVGPMITEVSEGVNSAAQAILNASPQTRQLLTLTLAAAIAIPAVTKAQVLLTAAQAAYKSLLAVLIPKQWSYAAALKATMGWLGLVAGALAVFSLIGDINSQAAETTADTADAFAKEKSGAEAAADGVDSLADSMAELEKAASGSLAAVDKLNIAGSSASGGSLTGGLVSQGDLDMIAEASGLTEDLKKGLADIEEQTAGMELFGNISLDGLYDAVSKAWEWLTTDGWGLLKSGVGAVFNTGENLWTLAFGSEQERTNSLIEMTNQITEIFGPEWTAFWMDTGTDIRGVIDGIVSGNEQVLGDSLASIDTRFKQFFGDFGEDWSEFWQGVGSGIYDFANGDLAGGLDAINNQFKGLFGELGEDWSDFWTNWSRNLNEWSESLYGLTTAEKSRKYASLQQDMLDTVMEELRAGSSSQAALDAAVAEHLTTNEARAWFNQNLKDAVTYDFVESLRRSIVSAELAEAGLAVPESINPFASPASQLRKYGGTSSTMADYYRQEGIAAEERKEQVINVNLQVDSYLDGEKVGESVTQRQVREQTLSNDY